MMWNVCGLDGLQSVMWNGMLYDVECLWPGWTTECDVEWYVVWCGMSVAWMDYRV